MAAEEEIQDEAAVRHQLLNLIDLHLVPAPIKEPAVVLVVEGIAGDSENPLLESSEFMFELDLVHRTIVRFVNVSFHAVKILLETAKNAAGELFVFIIVTIKQYIEHDISVLFNGFDTPGLIKRKGMQHL